ncbi:MAG: type II toxin-antitoxin system VapC family toxin [Acidobacteriia bacterium]|nr:type II toxin-antitoxin system VapC family toxin [Terriglobia bacterium]
MILPDVNVLIYALRNDSADHLRYRDWLEAVVNGPSPFGVSPQTLASVVRIVTNPRVFRNPTRLADVLSFCDALLGQPHCHPVTPGPRHWTLFRNLCAGARATGPFVQDAWFAALAMESGCEWITLDRDYARFEGLRWRTPF